MKAPSDVLAFPDGPRLPRRISRLLHAADYIEDIPPDERDDVTYWPRGLVQCTLPHADPGDVRAYLRRSGDFFLMIEPGTKLDRTTGALSSWGYPYGSYPRLCCSYLAREVRLKKKRRVFLGDSLSAFMAELGLIPTGGRWGSITNLRKQILALLNAKIAFGYTGAADADVGGHQLFADAWSLWWNTGATDQRNLFPSFIDISEPLFEDLSKSFPVDMAILRALKQSSLALDLYAFATSKAFTLKSTTAISWTGLHAQFGGSFTDVRDFRRKALLHLRRIQTLYPDFKFTLERGRIILWPSKTSVLPLKPR